MRMVAVTVDCYTNNPQGSPQCLLSYKSFKFHFSLLKVIIQKAKFNIEYLCSDMKNVPSKPSTALVFFLAGVNFWYEHMRLFLPMAKILFIMLYQAVGGKIILGCVTFLGSVTLPSQGNFTQTDVVYPAWVWLPS